MLKPELKNFLPQDTRIAELYGGIGLVLLALMTSIGFINLGSLVEVHPPLFWTVIFCSLGLIQIWAVALYPFADFMRVVMSWLNGLLWMWLSLVGSTDVTSSDVASWLLGAGNIYAFIINVTFLRKTWN